MSPDILYTLKFLVYVYTVSKCLFDTYYRWDIMWGAGRGKVFRFKVNYRLAFWIFFMKCLCSCGLITLIVGELCLIEYQVGLLCWCFHLTLYFVLILFLESHNNTLILFLMRVLKIFGNSYYDIWIYVVFPMVKSCTMVVIWALEKTVPGGCRKWMLRWTELALVRMWASGDKASSMGNLLWPVLSLIVLHQRKMKWRLPNYWINYKSLYVWDYNWGGVLFIHLCHRMLGKVYENVISSICLWLILDVIGMQV